MMPAFLGSNVELVLVDKSTGATIRLPQSAMVIELREEHGTPNMMSDTVLGEPKSTEVTIRADFLSAFRDAQAARGIEQRRQIGGQ